MQQIQPTAAVPIVIPLTIGLAWVTAALAQFSGSAAILHHDALIENGPPPAIALALFVGGWLLMIAAMMLPSSLPLIRMFTFAAANQERPALVLTAFLGGYALVWSAYGAVAFFGDVAVHRSVDRIAWLSARPWIVAGSVLAIAGAFQFTPLKDACLRACRLPGNFLMHHYGRGVRAAFALGYRHGLFCTGCCWALMLLGFAAGFASLWWMAALTALMTYERIGRQGRIAVPVAGVVLIVWSIAVFAHPWWLPRALCGL